MSAACKSCGARIVWVITAAGKKMPLDDRHHADGNVLVKNGIARVYNDPDHPDLKAKGVVRRRSHFATCPDASRWRVN